MIGVSTKLATLCFGSAAAGADDDALGIDCEGDLEAREDARIVDNVEQIVDRVVAKTQAFTPEVPNDLIFANGFDAP